MQILNITPSVYFHIINEVCFCCFLFYIILKPIWERKRQAKFFHTFSKLLFFFIWALKKNHTCTSLPYKYVSRWLNGWMTITEMWLLGCCWLVFRLVAYINVLCIFITIFIPFWTKPTIEFCCSKQKFSLDIHFLIYNIVLPWNILLKIPRLIISPSSKRPLAHQVESASVSAFQCWQGYS